MNQDHQNSASPPSGSISPGQPPPNPTPVNGGTVPSYSFSQAVIYPVANPLSFSQKVLRILNIYKYPLLGSIILVLIATSGILYTQAYSAKHTKKPIGQTIKKSPEAAVAKPTVVPATTPQPAAPAPAPAPVKTPAAVTPTKTGPAPAVPNCTKPTNFTTADVLSIDSSQPGLKEVNEPANLYEVYGYTADQIRSQINQCSPVSSFGGGAYDAYTSWNLNSTFDTSESGGKCTLTGVAVGLHIKTVMPTWQSTSYAAAGLSAKWSTYVANLTTHEHGHATLAEQYANETLSGLVSFPATDCSTIYQSAFAFAQAKKTALNQASASYDAQTGNGATQGARFP